MLGRRRSAGIEYRVNFAHILMLTLLLRLKDMVSVCGRNLTAGAEVGCFAGVGADLDPAVDLVDLAVVVASSMESSSDSIHLQTKFINEPQIGVLVISAACRNREKKRGLLDCMCAIHFKVDRVYKH